MLRSSGSDLLLFTTWKDGAWASFGLVGATVTTRDRPATAALGASFGVAFHGNDSKHYYVPFNGTTWGTVEGVTAGGVQSFGPTAPALGAVGGTPLVVYSGDNGDLFDQTRSAGNWSAAFAHQLGNVTSGTPAVLPLATVGDVLVVFRWKADSSLRSTTRKGGAWSVPVVIPNALSNDPPALARLPGGSALLAFRGTDGKLYGSSWNGTVWAQAAAVLGASNPTLKSAPSLSRGLLGDAELVYVEDNAVGAATHVTFSKGAWGPPALIGGTGLVGAAIERTP
jgi:hypothetical protein